MMADQPYLPATSPATGYDHAAIYRQVREALARAPGRNLRAIAEELNVDRHTVTRAIQRQAGLSFAKLQVVYMRQALEQLGRRRQPLLRKEVANQLGLASTRALQAWLERINRGSQNASSAPRSTQLRRPR
jgi:AraC-like DNA-binding protein